MFVYADNAATMPLRPEAYDAMLPILKDGYGNPSSIYGVARDARRALDEARAAVAETLHAKPDEIFFTSGGTESDNWALRGGVEFRKTKGKHMLTTAIEHPAILETARALAKQGYDYTALPVDSEGLVSVVDVEKSLRPDTILVSVMLGNNEIGTIQPVAEIGTLVRQRGILMHTDAVQAAGHIPIDLSALPVDMLSLSGHKFGGPKGVGVLFIRKGVRLPPLLTGGGHERGGRSGTENVAGAVGLAAALRRAQDTLEADTATLKALTDRLWAGLSDIPYAKRTGPLENRLPGHVSYVFNCVEGESLVLGLDFAGICASSGSACSSGSLDPSHVLLAIGLTHEVAHGSLRFTLNANNTSEEIDYLVETVKRVVAQKRSMSPLWDESKQEPIAFQG